MVNNVEITLPPGCTSSDVDRLIKEKAAPKSGPQGEFKELGRLRTTDSTEVVISQVYRGAECKGISISKFITTEKYVGFGKGVYLPNEDIASFLKLFPREELQWAIDTYEGES